MVVRRRGPRWRIAAPARPPSNRHRPSNPTSPDIAPTWPVEFDIARRRLTSPRRFDIALTSSRGLGAAARVPTSPEGPGALPAQDVWRPAAGARPGWEPAEAPGRSRGLGRAAAAPEPGAGGAVGPRRRAPALGRAAATGRVTRPASSVEPPPLAPTVDSAPRRFQRPPGAGLGRGARAGLAFPGPGGLGSRRRAPILVPGRAARGGRSCPSARAGARFVPAGRRVAP